MKETRFPDYHSYIFNEKTKSAIISGKITGFIEIVEFEFAFIKKSKLTKKVKEAVEIKKRLSNKEEADPEIPVYRNGLTPKDLMIAIASNPEIIGLRINHCEYALKHDLEGFASIINLTNLKVLNLMYNCLECDNIKILTKSLKTNKKLKVLHLSENKIGNEGARAIAGFLKKNQCLQILLINNNNIAYQGGNTIAGALKYNKSLNVIGIKGNGVEYKKFDKSTGKDVTKFDFLERSVPAFIEATKSKKRVNNNLLPNLLNIDFNLTEEENITEVKDKRKSKKKNKKANKEKIFCEKKESVIPGIIYIDWDLGGKGIKLNLCEELESNLLINKKNFVENFYMNIYEFYNFPKVYFNYFLSILTPVKPELASPDFEQYIAEMNRKRVAATEPEIKEPKTYKEIVEKERIEPIKIQSPFSHREVYNREKYERERSMTISEIAIKEPVEEKNNNNLSTKRKKYEKIRRKSREVKDIRLINMFPK
ncbi:MAG: hypothetical protein J0H68_01775 [Sphingobacteriia bacterium]|nr:hypothetical protein [Sphingobacteriia bacterium]